MINNHNLIIESVNTSTPKKHVDSESIIRNLSEEKEYYQDSYKKFGIYKRYISSDDENFEQLAFEASSTMLKKSNVSTTDISVLVVVSVFFSINTPEYWKLSTGFDVLNSIL